MITINHLLLHFNDFRILLNLISGVRTWPRSSGWTASKFVNLKWSRKVWTFPAKTWPSTSCRNSVTGSPCSSTHLSKGKKNVWGKNDKSCFKLAYNSPRYLAHLLKGTKNIRGKAQIQLILFFPEIWKQMLICQKIKEGL